jgi:hypothetical protein
MAFERLCLFSMTLPKQSVKGYSSNLLGNSETSTGFGALSIRPMI